MRRVLLRVMAVLTGWAVADTLSRYTHLLPGYGQSHGDDPVALAAWLVVSVALWQVARLVDH